MAYNPYYPGYMPTNQQPFYSQSVPDQLAQLRQNQMMQQMGAGQITQQSQNMPPQIPSANPAAGNAQNGIIWVTGKQEADNYLIAPNSAVALWDQNKPVVYLRKADSTGKPSTVIYDLVERTDIPPVQPAQQIDMSQYVTLNQLEEILSERLKKTAKVTPKKEDTE